MSAPSFVAAWFVPIVAGLRQVSAVTARKEEGERECLDVAAPLRGCLELDTESCEAAGNRGRGAGSDGYPAEDGGASGRLDTYGDNQ